MAKVRVQVSLFKDPIEVDESEIPGLRAQGILVGVAGETADESETVSTAGDGSSDDGSGTGSEPGSGQSTASASRQRRTAAG